MELLIASNNAHKQQELREIFAAIGSPATPVTLVTPRELGIAIDPDETADTYAGNARLKAFSFAQALRELPGTNRRSLTYVIADDSGLEVDALRSDMGDLGERVDFLERLLTRMRERGTLPPG